MCCTRYAEDRGAHPRAGGESSLRPITILSPAGSSPRGRGKPSETPLTPRSVRLIPARAGKTGREYRRSPGRRAHPRAGGENSPYGVVQECSAGSSPRGRGKPLRRSLVGPSGRLIPARAGKTLWLCGGPGRFGAHPRAGGENAVSMLLRAGFLGSSPRGRGKPENRS